MNETNQKVVPDAIKKVSSSILINSSTDEIYYNLLLNYYKFNPITMKPADKPSSFCLYGLTINDLRTLVAGIEEIRTLICGTNLEEETA